jgi:hypothetical protein
MLTTGYEGEIRFNSICDNEECDKRTWPVLPFFEKFKCNKYKKYVTNGHYSVYDTKQFKDAILEFTDAKFPNGPFMIHSLTWDIMIFFNDVQPLQLTNVA